MKNDNKKIIHIMYFDTKYYIYYYYNFAKRAL